jgi:transcriptional regulator with XRE-family HTH domain
MQMNSSLSGLGDRIRLQRVKRSLTQERLADLAGVSPRTVQRIEAGDEASAETVRLLAKALDVPMEQLRHPQRRHHFNAPWGKAVRWISGLMVAWTIVAQFLTPLYVALPLLGLVVGSLFFQVDGYSVDGGRLMVHRLGWVTEFKLSSLSRVEVNPQATMGAIRLFGNGGMFGITGIYRNRVLGRYRAFVTDSARAVVLEFKDRMIVVTPDAPQEFEAAILEVLAGSEAALTEAG